MFGVVIQVLLSCALLPCLVHAACTSFQPTTKINNDGLLPFTQPIIISSVVTCNGPWNCIATGGPGSPTQAPSRLNTTILVPTSWGGIVSEGPLLSIPTVGTVNENILTLISRASNLTFEEFFTVTTSGSIQEASLLPGQSAYATFTPAFNCISGILNGCTGDGYPANGTVVTACAPLQSGQPSACFHGVHGCLAGVYNFTITSNATKTANVTCQSCGDTTVPGQFPTAITPTSASSKTGSGVVEILIMAMVAAMFLM